MSALGGNADMPPTSQKCPLVTQSGLVTSLSPSSALVDNSGLHYCSMPEL
jgi:hypothetical protein